MLAALLSLATAAAPPACPAERAQYRLRGAPGVTAAFHPADKTDAWPSGLTLAIHVAETGRTYWWLPWNGGTDGMQHVRLTRRESEKDEPTWLGKLRPGVDQDFWTADAAYNLLDAVLAAGDAAPAYLLLPTLGRALYYGSVHSERVDNVPRAFFDLTGCRAAPIGAADVVLPAVP